MAPRFGSVLGCLDFVGWGQRATSGSQDSGPSPALLQRPCVPGDRKQLAGRDAPDSSLSSPLSADQPTNQNLLWSQTCRTRTQQNPLNLQTGAVAAAQRLLEPSPFPVCQTKWGRTGGLPADRRDQTDRFVLHYIFISSVNCRVQLSPLPVSRDVALKTGSADS